MDKLQHRRDRVFVAAAVLVLFGCVLVPRIESQIFPPQKGRARSTAAAAVSSRMMQNVTATPFIENGGRVSWYKGDRHDLIAYDSISDSSTKNMDVYTIRPDATGRRCVTCSSSMSQGFKGQMDWHPNGTHLVLLAEGRNSDHKFFNHPAWGVDNDLWMIRSDGTGAQIIWSPSEPGGGVLHPHFSHDGRTLMFAERRPIGRQLPRLLRGFGPHGENMWEGWRIHMADFNVNAQGTAVLTNHRTITPSGTGFYEPSGFTPDGRILYSYTGQGQPYCDDIFVANTDGSNTRNLTNNSSTWDEHGLYSPNGRYFSFMSSMGNPNLQFPRAKARDLTTEVYIKDGDSEPMQATRMNEESGRKMVVSRYSWNRSSNRIVFQVAALDNSRDPALWMLTIR
jgi:hypothetical protein